MPVVDEEPQPQRPAVYTPPPPGPAWPGDGSVWDPGTPGTAGTAGYTPDYLALLQSDPQYQAWKASAAGRNISFANQRAAIIRQLIVQYGGIPQAWADAFGDIRPEDIAAAQGNQFSTEQQIQHEYEKNVRQMRRQLAARGMLQSGELNFGQGEQDYARGQAENTAFTDFLGKVGGAVGDYTGQVAGVAGEEAGVVGSVMPVLRELYPTTPGTTGTPGTPGHWTTPKPKPPTTFTWGGKTWGAQGPWEKYAKAHGINIPQWYKQHSAAAKSIGVKGY